MTDASVYLQHCPLCWQRKREIAEMKVEVEGKVIQDINIKTTCLVLSIV